MSVLKENSCWQKWIFAKERINKGAQPYQDFALLLRLRDKLMHFKGSEPFDMDDKGIDLHQDLRNRFRNKPLLAEDADMGASSWTFLVETRAMADWSIDVASQMVHDFCAPLPSSDFQLYMDFFKKTFKRLSTEP